VALARADIELAFAHRWAELNRAPAALRAAIAAALAAEQQAALAARTRYLLDQAAGDQDGWRAKGRSRFAAHRVVSRGPPQAWMAAAKRLSRHNPQATRQGREGASRSPRGGHNTFLQSIA
jgi:hypothetical protein